MKNLSYTQKGFTLVETMVAIAILMLAILGPLSIAASGLRNSLYAKDEITAYYLAQEGIEYIRAARDKNYFDDTPFWYQGLGQCIVTSNPDGCSIDVYAWSQLDGSPAIEAAIASCTSPACDEGILYTTIDGNYTHTIGGEASRFRRSIKIKFIGLGSDQTTQAKITSSVTWPTPSGTLKSFELEELIFDLYKNQ